MNKHYRWIFPLIGAVALIGWDAIAGTEPINVDTANGHVKKTSSGTGTLQKPFSFCDVAVGGIPFLSLADAPSTYSGQALKCVRVNAAANALEFATCSSGGGGGVFVDLDFTGNNLTFMNGTTMWKSTGDATHPYTPTTAGMIFKDADNVEFGRIWFSNPDTGSNDNTRSVFIGDNAGANTTTHDSVAVGFNALSGGDISFGNTAVGSRALETINDVNADQNVAIGFQALQNLTTGYENVAIGYQAGKNLDSGIDNIAIGTNANIGSSTNNSIVIAHGVTTNADNVSIIGNAQNTDAYFGSVSGNAILHGKGVLPTGGTTGQYLTKIDSTDFNAHWITFPTPTATATFTPTPTSTPTATATSTATPTATATATPTPTPSATATAFPQGFTAHFSRGGAAIQANDVTLTPWTTKYTGTITGFIISADQGTCTLKVWKKATGTAIPTIADVINTSGVSLATGTHIDSTTVTDFTTTTVSVGDQFMAQVTAVSGGATDITFQIPIRQ